MDKALYISGIVCGVLCFVMGLLDVCTGQYLWAGLMAICSAANANTVLSARKRMMKQ